MPEFYNDGVPEFYNDGLPVFDNDGLPELYNNWMPNELLLDPHTPIRLRNPNAFAIAWPLTEHNSITASSPAVS
jgi:hypothetical protein